ncbi:MAG: RNA-dependent RNA polymerase [Plant associated deltapartitivirus 3]|nr:MAG: RNA-dependent RNA polymerase [Plant associated deltapartitivirus 3]
MLRDIRDYQFTEFTQELEELPGDHPHIIRREPEQVITDNYALAILNDAYPTLYEQSLQGWARSYYTQEGHMNTIMAYATPDTPYSAVNHELYQQAFDAVQNELCSLPLTRAFNVLTDLDKIRYEQSSSAGYNYIGPKGPIDGDNHKRAIRSAVACMWSALRDTDGGPAYFLTQSVPDVGYTRTQLADLSVKTKVRGVWGRAFHYILLEGTAARPLLDAFIEGKTFLHIGEDPQHSVPDILSNVSRHAKWLYALDWSGFDTSVSRFEIEHAFKLLKARILFPNNETEQVYELSRLLFTHKKIAAPDGKIYWSHRGIPSGSFYTTMIGSIINRLRVEYIWRQIKGRGPKLCYTQGDDSLIGDDELIHPRDMAAVAAPLGWTINTDKTAFSTSPEFVTFLGRTTYGGFNQRELMRCIRLLVFPEHPVESGSISAFRARAINQDSGHTSEIIRTVAERLRRLYGIPSDKDVPAHFRRYYA